MTKPAVPGTARRAPKTPSGAAAGRSLATRIFLFTALLIALSVGTAVVLTTTYGNRVAGQAARDSLQASHAAQATAQQQRYEQLELVGQIFSTDSNLAAYMAEAAESADVTSVLDLMSERQADLGYDFAMLLDPEGRVVARSDKPGATGDDLSETGLVAKALENNEASGVLAEGNRLYYAVAVPVVKAFVLQGYLVTGYAIDDRLALEIKRASGIDIAYLASSAGGPRVVASTLDDNTANRLVQALRLQGDLLQRVLERGEAVDDVRLDLDGSAAAALLSPLRDAAERPVGAVVAETSLAQATAGYRRIRDVLVAVGIGSVLLAGALSYVVSRRTLRPVTQLVAATEAARQGNFDLRIATGAMRRDEVGQLARSFDVLLANLREKRDMEAYVAELSRNLPDAGPGAGSPATSPPAARQLALLALELRSFARKRVTLDPPASIERLSRDLRRIVAAVESRHGRMESLVGHRALAVFDGETRVFAALAAAAEIVPALSVRENAFDDSEPPAIVIGSGEAVVGGVLWGQGGAEAVIGLPVQQLEALLREALPGDLLLTPEAHAELRDTLAAAGEEIRPQRALLSSVTIYPVPLEMATRVTGGMAHATAVSPLGGEPAEGASPTLAGIAPGALLGQRFQILGVLGAGGMGVVYKARDRELDDLVALKMLKRDVGDDAELLARLKSELKLARKITHPNVLRTFDFGEIDGMQYISMEYVRGITLRFLLDREGRLPFSAGLRLAKQLCAGLGAAHAAGVLHRDIKPENLILDATGNAKLMDFGIARPTRRLAAGQTQAGWVVGTPQYLSPEQIEGREADERSDIYACGVVLYEIFTGHPPFRGESPMQILLQHLHEVPPPPSNLWPEMPRELEAIILRCLEKDREGRFRDVADLNRALEGLSA